MTYIDQLFCFWSHFKSQILFDLLTIDSKHKLLFQSFFSSSCVSWWAVSDRCPTLVLTGVIWTFEIATYPLESSTSQGNPTPRHMPTSKPRTPLHHAKDGPHLGWSDHLSFLIWREWITIRCFFFFFLIAVGKYRRVRTPRKQSKNSACMDVQLEAQLCSNIYYFVFSMKRLTLG